MPSRLTIVGDLERKDHYHLHEDDKCYFWGEYTSYEHTGGKKWDFSPTNKLISNFKKKMDRVQQLDWHYKQEAIEEIARQFSSFFKWEKLQRENHVALIPIPPSRARTDPLFDPRITQMLNKIAEKINLDIDIRDCLSFNGINVASHATNARPTPDELFADLVLDHQCCSLTQQPHHILLFDDMLTTGAHFVAVKRRLAEVFPGASVTGVFIARRLLPDPLADLDIADLV